MSTDSLETLEEIDQMDRFKQKSTFKHAQNM